MSAEQSTITALPLIIASAKKMLVAVLRDPEVKAAARELLAPAAPPPRLLSAEETATALRVATATVRRWRRDGVIPSIGSRFDLEAVKVALANAKRKDRAKAATRDEESGVSVASIAAKNGLKLAGGSR